MRRPRYSIALPLNAGRGTLSFERRVGFDTFRGIPSADALLPPAFTPSAFEPEIAEATAVMF